MRTISMDELLSPRGVGQAMGTRKQWEAPFSNLRGPLRGLGW